MGTRIVDDRDPSISYTSAWSTAGGSNEYNFTTSWTTSQGHSATIRFSGSGIGAYGTITNEGLGNAPISAYSIDGGAETRYTGVQRSDIQYKIRFFQSGVLSSGDHTLVVTCATGDAILYLDYFEITLPSITSSSSSSVSSATPTPSRSTTSLSLSSPLPSPSSPSPSLSSSSTSSTSSLVSPSSSTATSGASVSQPFHITEILSSTVTVTSDGFKASDIDLSSSSTKSVAVGPIAGGVVGGILVLALLLFLFLFCQRRRRWQANPITLPNSPSTNRLTNQVTPFDIGTPSTPYFPPYTEATGSPSHSLASHQQLYAVAIHSTTDSSGIVQSYPGGSAPMALSTHSLLPKRQSDASVAVNHQYPPNVNSLPSSSSVPLRSYVSAAQAYPTGAINSEKRDLSGQSYRPSSVGAHSGMSSIDPVGHRASDFTYDPPPSYNDVRQVRDIGNSIL